MKYSGMSFTDMLYTDMVPFDPPSDDVPSVDQTDTRKLMPPPAAPKGPIGTGLDSRNLLSSRLDALVRSGALTVGQGHGLTLDKDGLPIVSNVNPKTKVTQSPEQQRLDNVIQFLESPIAPQSVDWNSARKVLGQLRDKGISREGDTDLMAWNIVMDAHRFTIQDHYLLESLLELLEAKKLDAKSLKRINELAHNFLTHACALVGVSTPDHLGDNAWDDGLAEIVLGKSVEVYRCINEASLALRDGQQRGFQGSSTDPEQHLRRFLNLDVIKVIKDWRYHDAFVILERKAITAHRSRQAST